jgi:hypothetical protein
MLLYYKKKTKNKQTNIYSYKQRKKMKSDSPANTTTERNKTIFIFGLLEIKYLSIKQSETLKR